MSRESGLPVDGDSLDAALDAELARVLEAYLADLEAGRPVDPDRLLAEHPDLAEQLRSCLAVVNLADRVADASATPPGSAAPRRAAVASLSGQSALTSLGLGADAIPRVHLRDVPDEREPLVRPRGDAMPLVPQAGFARYQLQGEIARGGMGAVLKGRDVDLGRDLAIKVLLEAHQGNPEVVRRFVEEAQIGGQLQHPGIVPVFELGTMPDRRPYFAMKLVKGRTLAALLGERAVAERARPPHPNPPPPRGEGFRDSSPLVGEDTGGGHRAGNGPRGGVGRESPEPRRNRVGRGSPDPALRPTEGLHPVASAGHGSPDGAGRGLDRIPAAELNVAPDETSDKGQRTKDKGQPPIDGLQPQFDDLPRFLSIFEQVCQTMAYAHARGVIHRDLKPSNIMVGSFGEVQVMDWGLAKVLPEGGVADEAGARPARETVIMTVRSGSAGSGSESQAGSVLGTPAYMPPEQARGEIDRIDERADVFGLGAILCEILTGQPPFAAGTREEIRAQSARGDLGDALFRLGACGAEPELIDLARDCLAPERGRRPRSAGQVSRRMTAFLTGLQERLRAAELARAAEQARAEEAQATAAAAEARARAERQARRLTAGLAAAVLVVVGLLAGGSTYLARQRMARLAATTRVVTEALAEAEQLRGQAQAAAGENQAKWFEAVVAARRARDLLAEDEADQALRQHVNDVLAALEREQAAALKQAAEAERDRKLLGELEAIRGNRIEYLDPKQSDREYAAAFRSFGIDLDRLDPEEAGKQIARRSAPVELASYVDDWAMQRLNARDKKEEASWRRLLAAARAADPDPWRVALREQMGGHGLDALRRLAANERELDAQSPPSLFLLAVGLRSRGDRGLAERMLRRAWRIKPDDFWVNYLLGEVHFRGTSSDAQAEAVRYFSAAVVIRPRSAFAHNGLGASLGVQGKVEEAVAEYREAIRLKSDHAIARNNLGGYLAKQGKLEEAVREYREVIRLKPEHAGAHNNLGTVLLDQGKLKEAMAEFREALRLNPNNAAAHSNLGIALRRQGKLEEAMAEVRVALRLNPADADAHNNLGAFLSGEGKLDEAITEGREALRLRPGFPEAHLGVGEALDAQGNLNAAMAEYREAIRTKPDYANAHMDLGVALGKQGKLEAAVAEFREAIRLKPGDAPAHANLGNALKIQGKLAEAIGECRIALRLNPDLWEAHGILGSALTDHGKLDEAIGELRTALRLNPVSWELHCDLGFALTDHGKLDEGIGECRTALRLKPESAEAHDSLGYALAAQGKLAEAIGEYRTALRLKPSLAEAHNHLGNALQNQRRLAEAVREYHTALRLKSDYPEAHNNLGSALKDQGKLGEAVTAYRTALRLRPAKAAFHNNLGNALKDQGKLDEAIGEYRAALRLNPDSWQAHCNLGVALQIQGKLDQAVAEFREAVRIKPDFADAHLGLGQVLQDQGKPDQAIAEYRESIKLKPDYVLAHIEFGAFLCDIRHDYDGAITEFRIALRLEPENARAHLCFGVALAGEGKLDQAATELRTAIRHKPDNYLAHNNLGNVLWDQGKLQEAVAEYREAIRLKPDFAEAHNNLGAALKNLGSLGEAINEYRAALRLKPDFAEAHANLGRALRSLGEFAEAIVEFRNARDLAKTDAARARQAEQELIATEQQAVIAARLPAVLSGKLKSANAAESLAFAQLCYDKKLHGSSARLWAEAFQAEPKVADDMQAQNRYNAACAAALAGSGQGKDDPPLDQPTKARWRKQAIDWLKADLAAWSKMLEKGTPAARQSISKTLQHWQTDPDLAGVRDAAALAKLSEDEQKACRALWAEVDALLKKARDARP